MSHPFDYYGERERKETIDKMVDACFDEENAGVDLSPVVLELQIEVDRLREQRDRAMSDLAHANLVIHEKAVEMHDMRARLDDGS